MRPVFSSTRQAAAFGALLGILLLLPVLIAKMGWLDRGDAYLFVNKNAGPFPWIYQQIFIETNDVDIAFVGSSRMMTDISTPAVKRELSGKLHADAEVFTIAWNWGGYDALYTIARDLLEHRRVRMMVVCDDLGQFPHPFGHYWLRMGEQSDVRAGMPLLAQMSCYANEVLGAPRCLLKLVRPVQFDSHWDLNPFYLEIDGANFKEQLGSMRKRLGIEANPANFIPFQPRGLATPADARVYSPASRDAFVFNDAGRDEYQLYFARKLAEICRQHGTWLVALYLPALDERNQTAISWRAPWREFSNGSAMLVGIPAARLFAGISDADVQKLFYNNDHMNQNGQDYFTPLIIPALLNLYATSTNSF